MSFTSYSSEFQFLAALWLRINIFKFSMCVETYYNVFQDFCLPYSEGKKYNTQKTLICTISRIISISRAYFRRKQAGWTNAWENSNCLRNHAYECVSYIFLPQIHFKFEILLFHQFSVSVSDGFGIQRNPFSTLSRKILVFLIQLMHDT